MKQELPGYFNETHTNASVVSFALQRPFFEPNNGATSWYAEIGLGTPVQHKLRFMIDTGTKNTWITSNLCTTTACAPHNKFNPSASSTYHVNGKQAEINFGAWGSMTITPSKDVISLPNIANPQEIIFDMSTNYTGSQFQELICDGGLGIPSHIFKEHNSSLILNLLKQEGLISSALASFWYNRTSMKGEVLFGGIDKSKFDAGTANKLDLIKFPTDRECWLVNLDNLNGLFADGTSKNILTNVAFALDTGSSQFKGDPKFIDAAKKVITNNGQYPETIQSPAKVSDYPYPVLELVLNGVSYKLPPEKYFIRSSETEWNLAFHFLDGCENEFLVGTTFLETVYSIFDFDNRCITLAHPRF